MTKTNMNRTEKNAFAGSYAAAGREERVYRDTVNKWIMEEFNYIPTAMFEDMVNMGIGDWEEINEGYETLTPKWTTVFLTDAVNNGWYSDTKHQWSVKEAGFRLWHSKKYDRYILGIDDEGCDFMAKHWIPLYEARQL